MSGSARSLSMSMFSGLRAASTNYTPAYSKNGVNVSSKLNINAFMNIASRANGGEGRNEALSLTVWGKLADICAISMSPGKEFHATAQLHVYEGRVFMPTIAGQPGTPVLGADGQPLMTKKFSYTIQMLTFGEESNKHIANEIQAGVRRPGWNIAGHPDQLHWKETLALRQKTVFDARLPTFGYARVYMPQGAGIGAYIASVAAPVVAPFAGPAFDTTAAVTATFAQPVPAIVLPAAAPAANASGFIVAPAGV